MWQKTKRMKEIRVSIGSLGVLGIKKIKLPAPPTTLYLMIGERCMYDCAYCPQAYSSHGSTDFLSRVIWPKTYWDDLKEAVQNTPSIVKRICFQVVSSPHFLEDTLFFIEEIKKISLLPISVSIRLNDMKDLRKLFDAGTERVGLALDVATEHTYKEYRGGDFNESLNFILSAGRAFPHRVTTHIIVGMGETDKDLYNVMNKMYESTITVGLFAFTPIKGTKLENMKPPLLKRYRRIQLMRYLFYKKIKFEPVFDERDNLISLRYYLPVSYTNKKLLSDPNIFVTSGCPNCNRPYYNEEPLGPMFNYPFPVKNTSCIIKEFVKNASKNRILFKV